MGLVYFFSNIRTIDTPSGKLNAQEINQKCQRDKSAIPDTRHISRGLVYFSGARLETSTIRRIPLIKRSAYAPYNYNTRYST